MKLKIEDIAVLDGPVVRSRARRVHTRALLSPSRRDFLKAAIAVGTGVGLAALGLFPTARGARAGHGDSVIKDGCADVNGTGDDNCGGCNTARRICCCNSNGFHRADGCNYAHRPNDCPSSPYDGWFWRYAGCCVVSCDQCCTCRTDQKWRCTDGYYRADCSNNWTLSICRDKVNSGTGCAPCPC